VGLEQKDEGLMELKDVSFALYYRLIVFVRRFKNKMMALSFFEPESV
jgi:hypothetical protein